MRGLSLVAASGGHSSSRCAGLSLSRPLSLRSTGSRRTGSVVVAHGPSRSAACGIFPDQGSNPCPLRWQADSQPLCHQGSPKSKIFWWCIIWSNFYTIMTLFIKSHTDGRFKAVLSLISEKRSCMFWIWKKKESLARSLKTGNCVSLRKQKSFKWKGQ